MILQELVRHYETLADRKEISPPGWRLARVSYALDLNDDGTVAGLHSLKTPQQSGKKQVMLPQSKEVPMQEGRSSGVFAYFLCDHSGYLLGADNKGKPKRTQECFAACRLLHQAVLKKTDTPAAKAVLKFFADWDPAQAARHPALAVDWDELMKGANLVFWHCGKPVTDDPMVRSAWQQYYDREGEEAQMQCLVTGEASPIPNTHPVIKGVHNAQAMGAALVSFNAPAYESYNRQQNLNAPVGKYAAFAYTTALNHLLADREHCQLMGDTTVVCWAQGGEPAYSDFAMMGMMGNSSDTEAQAILRRTLSLLAAGEPSSWNDQLLDPDTEFYILGLSPNVARISVRFFLKNSFGNFMKNLEQHYQRLEITAPDFERWKTLPLWKLLAETVNQKSTDKSASPQMAGDVLRAVLEGTRYPATLLNAVMLRIRAEHTVTYGRAAIIKAYYLKNQHPLCPKEVLTVSLNETSTNVPYTMGRLFSIFEAIQQAANPGINATIKDKYFNSASATPATVFPILCNLAQKHLRKLETGKRIYFERQLGMLSGLIGESYPARLSLPEQGCFQLGYYHQYQMRFEKKGEKENGSN